MDTILIARKPFSQTDVDTIVNAVNNGQDGTRLCAGFL